ncbi:MAG: creatininase family protein [Pseudomonadota bacterium]
MIEESANGQGVWLGDLTWPEAQTWFERQAPIVIPIGAAAKEHGHHLPLATDFIVAEHLAEALRQNLPVVIAPVVGFGYYPAFTGYSGSQHLKGSTYYALLWDLIEGFVTQGVTRIVVINTGVSTEATVENVCRDTLSHHGVRVAFSHIRVFGASTREDSEQKLGGHADEQETSVMLAIHPGRVYLDRAVPDYGTMLDQPGTVFQQPVNFKPDPESGPDYSVRGARGDPTLATVEKGERALAAMVERLVSGLTVLYPDLRP